METFKGRKLQTTARLRVSRPKAKDRKCRCGRKISIYNPNKTCWEHTPVAYIGVRGKKNGGLDD